MRFRVLGVWDSQSVPLRMLMAKFWDPPQDTWRQQHLADTRLGWCIKLLSLMPCPGTQPSSRLSRTDGNESE